ncbi:hypothetical protein KJ567_03000, partial [Candidatus Bipolaricaulota bacterium]|nr:hypothetical protein [Candidatus Bipolaricaulota bacterium]
MKPRALATLLVCLAVVALTARADFARRVESEHFAIHYTSGNSRDAVSAEYARLVQDGLESAYAFYVASGFDMYTGRIDVHILRSEWGELGAEYDDGMPGEFSPVIEIATQAVMEETLAESFVEVSVEGLVASTCAHELFHVVHDHYANQGLADMAEV